MLNEIEELYLDHLIERAEISIVGYGDTKIFTPDIVIAMLKRLKEINNECSRYALELQQTNEEVARLHEMYGA